MAIQVVTLAKTPSAQTGAIETVASQLETKILFLAVHRLSTAISAESHQVLSMAVVASHAQEAMFQATAFEVGCEFALDIAQQNRALLCKVCRELRIITFNGRGICATHYEVVTFVPVPLITQNK